MRVRVRMRRVCWMRMIKELVFEKGVGSWLACMLRSL